MKKVLTVVVLFIAVALLAQTSSTPWSGNETQQLLANCVTHNTDDVVCVATDGVAFSYHGAAFVKVSSPGSATAGVSSFNARTGAVAPASGDYSFGLISGNLSAGQLPASTKCNLTFTLNAPTTGTTTNQLNGVATIGGCQ